jgi:adenylate cyclase
VRREVGKPAAAVDLALHVGEVLYGKVARIETLCEPLGRKVLVSAEFAAAAGDSGRLEPLGYHRLRGVQEPRAIYGLDL